MPTGLITGTETPVTLPPPAVPPPGVAAAAVHDVVILFAYGVWATFWALSARLAAHTLRHAARLAANGRGETPCKCTGVRDRGSAEAGNTCHSCKRL